MSFDKLLNTFQRSSKEPGYWPFCICCHLRAPESKEIFLDAYDRSKGMGPDVSAWGLFTAPNKTGHKEQYHMCQDCTAFIAVQLYRNHKALKQKFEKIKKQRQAKDICGLRLAGHLNPFRSAFCSKPKGHTDACS